MNLRDWLIVIGVIIIVGILIDGYRRMRLARKDSLQISRDMGGDFENTPLDDMPNPELPGGGARVVAKGEDSDGSDDFELSSRTEPHIDEPPISETSGSQSGDMMKMSAEGETEVLVADVENRVDIESRTVPTAHAVKREHKKKTGKADQKASDHSVGQSADQEVLVINVHSRHEQVFAGRDIKQLLHACGLEHGEMSIFHRHEEDDLLSPVQFSVANSIEPGYFDPETLEESDTPGVSFFMSLPGPKNYMKAFEYMLETAQCFAKNLGGELKDEHRSVMTSQTIEHFRQRIREFERKQLSKSRV